MVAVSQQKTHIKSRAQWGVVVMYTPVLKDFCVTVDANIRTHLGEADIHSNAQPLLSCGVSLPLLFPDHFL